MTKIVTLEAERSLPVDPASPLTAVDLRDLQDLLAGMPLSPARRLLLHDRLQHLIDAVSGIKAAM